MALDNSMRTNSVCTFTVHGSYLHLGRPSSLRHLPSDKVLPNPCTALSAIFFLYDFK